MTWEYRVLRDIFDDELGNLARDYVGSAASWSSLAMLLEEPRSRWWDDTNTAGLTETADLIILRAMDEAGAELRAAYGGPENWSWGRLHTATFEEGTLGASGIGPLEWYFNHGPIAVPGVAGAVNNTYHRLSRAYPDPTDPDFEPVGVDRLFAVTNLPSYRLTMDLSISTGPRSSSPPARPATRSTATTTTWSTAGGRVNRCHSRSRPGRSTRRPCPS